jgi:hypothetical protein
MELIPILSTIILVATICTFILAIGAYILYKVRERRGEQASYSSSSTVHAELVTPDETSYSREEYTIAKGNLAEEPTPLKKVSKPGVYPAAGEYQSAKPRYYPTAEEEQKNVRLKTTSGGRKFLKYTSEGYVPTEDDKKTGVLKWR